MTDRRTWTDQQLIALVPDAYSWADLIRGLGLNTKGAGNWRTVQKHTMRLQLDVSHFTGRSQPGNRSPRHKHRYTDDDVFVTHSTYATSRLLPRLLEERERKCESCELKNWLGQPIPLEVDHINGIRDDHRKCNLKLLCPNCHALTPTWRGRKNRKAR